MRDVHSWWAKYGTMEVTKRKAMQQLWHYRPQTCSGDKKQFYQHRSWESITVTHWPVRITTVTSMSHKKWNRPDLNKVEETWRNKYFFTFLCFLSCPGRRIIISLAVRRTTHDIHYIPIWCTFTWKMYIKSVTVWTYTFNKMPPFGSKCEINGTIFISHLLPNGDILLNVYV